VDSPGKALAGAASTSPTRTLLGQLARHQHSRPLEPKSSNTINHFGTEAREAPPWWHANLCGDQKHTRLDDDQKTTILGKILAKDTHETPGKTLAGDDHDATARPLPGPRQDSFRKHPWGRSRAHVCQDSTIVPMQPPAHQLGRRTRGNVWPLGRLGKHLCGGMQIFVTIQPAHQLSSQPTWHYTPRQFGCASKPGEAATAGTSFLAIHDKARRARQQCIKCVCPTVPGDRLDYCIPFHLLCSTVASPFDYKRRPEAY